MSVKRICLYGGAGSGKSATALGLARELKVSNFKIELVTEYIKTWAYEGRFPKSFQQIYIFAKQMNSEDVLMDHVDCIVTDSPLLMNAVYAKKHNFDGWPALLDFALLFEKQFPALNIFLDREGIEYKQEGRYEDLEGAVEMDRLILQTLDHHVPYQHIRTVDFDLILQTVIETLEKNDSSCVEH